MSATKYAGLKKMVPSKITIKVNKKRAHLKFISKNVYYIMFNVIELSAKSNLRVLYSTSFPK